MDTNTLNRIGIILNFLAGFLLAPELIGVERIRRLEFFLENKIESLKSYSSNLLDGYLGTIKGGLTDYLLPSSNEIPSSERIKGIGFYFPFILAGISATLGYVNISIGILAAYLGIFILSGSLKQFLGIFGIRKIEASSSTTSNFKLLRWLWLTSGTGLRIFYLASIPVIFLLFLAFNIIYMSIGIFILSLLTVLRDLISFITKITSWLLKLLYGEDALQGFLVGVGVLLFIIGNMLQFIATY